MHLRNLQLHQFKNHTESQFTFTEKVICFVGDNGAGKTNILDAIHYLSQTKSYFNHIDAQNIQFDENYFMLKGVFNKDESDAEIQCNIIEGDVRNKQDVSNVIKGCDVVVVSLGQQPTLKSVSFLDSGRFINKKSCLKRKKNTNKEIGIGQKHRF